MADTTVNTSSSLPAAVVMRQRDELERAVERMEAARRSYERIILNVDGMLSAARDQVEEAIRLLRGG